MDGGKIIFKTELDNKTLEKDLARASKKINDIEKNISSMRQKRFPLVEQSKQMAAVLDEAKAKLYEMRNAARGVFSAEEVAEQKERVRALQSEWNKIQGAVENYDRKISEANIDLAQAKAEAGGIQQRLAKAGPAAKAMAKATEKAQKSAQKFSLRMREVVRSALVFSLITKALSMFKDWMGKVIKTNEEATKAISQLKGELLTMAQPLVEVLVPAFTAFVKVLTRVVSLLSQFISSLSGSTADASREAAAALKAQTDAIEEQGEAAKKASKSLTGFDEINRLSSESGSANGSGTSDAVIAPDFSGIKSAISDLEVYMAGASLAVGAVLAFSGFAVPLGIALMGVGAAGLASALSGDWDAMPESIRSAVSKTLLVLGGASLVVGAVLAFSGVDLLLGIGLMAAGAAALATGVSVNWDAVSQQLQGPLGATVSIISGSLLALGALLAFSGVNIPLGIVLMAAGAAGLATTVSANWNAITEALHGPMGAVVALMSGGLLALGAILAFSGAAIPLGIGLMVVGAAGLAGVAALNWNGIVDALRGPIGAVVAVASSALFAIGAILTFSGVNLPLGIGMMIAGAAGLAGVAALNWEYITQIMQGKVGKVMAIAGGALLAIGLILAFSGVGLGLGLGLIAAGAASLGTAAAFNWNFIAEKVKGAWEMVRAYWRTNIAPVFTVLWWSNLAKSCGNGMISGFESTVNGIIGMFEKMINWIVDGLNQISFDVPDWIPKIGGKTIGVNIPPVSFGRVNVPRLATGGVIPPNREFMAVLGDNKKETEVVSPLSTMKQALIEAMQETGGLGGNLSLSVSAKPGLARYLKIELDAESARRGAKLVGGAVK